MKMKKLILLAMTPVLFTACGNDDSKKVGAGNNINKTTNPVAAELNGCSEDNVKSYQAATDAVTKATSYFNSDGSLTPAGQFVDVNAVAPATKTACAYFIDNYGPIDCKSTATESLPETIIRGSEVAKNCDSTIKFLQSIGRN